MWDETELDPDGYVCSEFAYCDQSPFAFADTQLDQMEGWFSTDQTGWLGRDDLFGAWGKQSGFAVCHAATGEEGSHFCTDAPVGVSDERGGPGIYDFAAPETADA